MILKAEVIAKLLDESEHSRDPLVITPEPNIEKLRKSGSASIDLRMGTWFLTLRQTKIPTLDIDIPTTQMIDTHYIPFGEQFYVHPRRFVLGITMEWIRLPRDLAGYVIGRSSWGRRGLIIATATGVHPGFTGCLTLEISNIGEIPIAIKPGMSICQLFLHQVQKSSDAVDQTPFIGRRKPVIGVIKEDPIAKRLGDKKI